jgi:glycosyltransferase involved in cell wall biosynthesis
VNSGKKRVKRRSKLRMNAKKERPNICIITSPRPMAGVVPLSNLVDVLYPLSHDLYVVTGNEGNVVCKDHEKVHGYSIVYKAKTQVVARIFNYIYLQLRISYRLIKLARNVDLWIFFMGEGLLLPALTLRWLGKPIILSLAASSPKMIEANNDISLCNRIPKFLELINYSLSNRIILYSPNLIKDWNLEKYRKKISITGAAYKDTDNFKIKKKLNDKRNLIGYIGRLSPEKGVLNFAKAIPLILKERSDLDFLIGGNGVLFDKIKNELKCNGSYDKVELTGWISHDELPKYLNELKLIVAPSYTEGGVPTAIMEAMACGTVSLVTPVAGVDVIKDGESGFILENNSPECIAKNVIRALEHPNLDEIVNNACNLVEEEFSYEKVVKQYRDIIYRMLYK